MCKTVTWLTAVAQQNSRYQVLVMTIDKYVAIKWPHRAVLYSTTGKTKSIITGMLIFAVIYNIPHIFFPRVVNGKCLGLGNFLANSILVKIYVSLRLRVQNAVPARPCVGKIRISLVLLNFLHCNFRLWFETP